MYRLVSGRRSDTSAFLLPRAPNVYSTAYIVKHTAYMSIRDAIDELGRRVTHEEIAAALGVSVASVRQYRLATDAKAHRSPPRAWKRVLAALARERANELATLADELENPDQLSKED